MFARKSKKTAKIPYDKEKQKPVLKCSICTGEQVAGFQDISTGKIQEVMLVKDSRDLEEFRKLYELKDIRKVY
ncbi:MAG: aspartate dehydrogenase [Lachnospiraceae bacterium]|jgi:hypothetical protein|nr:aspartate dehydrogenase [Lachnospiraceae bacterium]